ncbi:hypothetical protein [Streptomyces nigra]|uniref:hypothetical protein n=1 Tax=Streptomyces nigra TaxID=1827580 RepID=UPI0035DE1680
MRRTGNPLRATAVATGAGRALGWLLVVGGLYLFLFGALFSGSWLVVLGWFLIAMAAAEGGQAHVLELLKGVPVRQAMGHAPVTVPASLTGPSSSPPPSTATGTPPIPWSTASRDLSGWYASVPPPTCPARNGTPPSRR